MTPMVGSTTLSDVHFQGIVSIAATDAGLAIPVSKKSLVQSRVTRRMRKIGVNDCDAYLALLDHDGAERQELICVLTTNVSHFYREQHHFESVAEKILKKAGNSSLRFWSAGCSNGQEPYTLAFEILKHIPDAASKDILVLATDIDPQVLRKARSGIYTESEIDGVPSADRSKLFDCLNDGSFCVTPEISRLVRFRQLNLNGPWPIQGSFDAIFCRNVVIYFSDQTQSELWPRFGNHLKSDGLLLLGHSERIHPLEGSGFESAGVTTYRKLRQ